MTEIADTDLLSEAREAFERSNWGAASQMLAKIEAKGGLEDEDRVLLAVSLIRSGEMASGLQALRDVEVLSFPSIALVRRTAIAPFIREGSLEGAAELLALLDDKRPDDVLTLTTQASVLGRLGRHDEARRSLERCSKLAPDNPVVATQMIQLHLRSGEVAEASRVALSRRALWPRDARLAGMAALALERAGELAAACEAGRTAVELEPAAPQFAAVAMRALIETGDPGAAVRIGEACLARGGDSNELHLALIRALEACGAEDPAIEPHLIEALENDPGDIRLNRSLAQIELRSGRSAEAVARLTGLVSASPALTNLKVELAHALRAESRFADSARLIGEVSDERPGEPVWLRMASAMYARAGDEEAAQDYYQRSVTQRDARLPGQLSEGLAGLWDRVDAVALPEARLNWAWSLTQKLTPADQLPERAQWHRDAIWGHLADHMILDWLECRTDRIEEISDLRDGPPEVIQPIRSALDGGQGVLLASAHVGAMFAGPALLAETGLPFRWLASTPSLKAMRHSGTLISTSGQSERRVAAQALTALKQRNVVVVALDGSISPASPMARFEGKRISYSDFGPRAVAASGARAFFVAPYWHGERLQITLTPLPDMEEGQTLDQFAEAWRSAYFGCLRDSFTRGGRNLRLNGGFWRFVR